MWALALQTGGGVIATIVNHLAHVQPMCTPQAQGQTSLSLSSGDYLLFSMLDLAILFSVVSQFILQIMAYRWFAWQKMQDLGANVFDEELLHMDFSKWQACMRARTSARTRAQAHGQA